MKLVWRQKIGIAMIAASVIAAAAIQAVTNDLVHVSFDTDPPKAAPHGSSEMYTIDVTLAWRYALPLGTCVTCGFVLALLPPIPRRTAPSVK